MSDFDPFAVMRTLDGPLDPPESFSEELYTTLRHSMDRHAVGAPPEEIPAPATSPRRGLLVAAAVVAAFFAMGGLLALFAPPGEPEANVDPQPLSEPDPTASTSIVEHNEDPSVASPPPTSVVAPVTTIASQVAQPSLGGYQFGGWNVLPASEFDGRLGAAVVWTGEQLIVWGGEVPDGSQRPDSGWPVTNTGGTYDPGSNTWFSIPSGPLSARSGAAAVWTGTEMLIMGGQAGSAAYDPATRLWRELPSEALPIEKATVWTGTEALVVSGAGVGRAYNPQTDQWRALPAPPLEQRAVVSSGPGSLISSVWTGEEMIVWGGWVAATGEKAAQGFTIVWGRDGAAYNPVTDEWRQLPKSPNTLDLSSTSAVWTGEEMIVWGANFEAYGRGGPLEDTPYLAGAAYNPATDAWRVIATPPFVAADETEGFGIHSATWIDDRMVIWAGSGFLSATGPELWAYDPATDTWERGASAPFDAEGVRMVWTGDTLYAVGGDMAYPLPRTMELPLREGGLPEPVGTADTLALPAVVPFEILALEPFVQSAFIGNFPEGQGRFFDRSDTFLQEDAISNAAPLWDGWVTSANGEVWWFPDSISRLPIALQNEPDVADGLQGFTYFLPTRDDLYSDRIWTVVPGDGFARPNARSIVRSISVETREVKTFTEIPPDAFPVNSSTTGLLLNSFEWMDTGDGFVEEPATFKMMVVEPDGNLLPLWAGFGIDLSVNRVVWMDCDEAGAECAIVVSSIKGPSPADLRIEIPGFTLQNGAVASPNGRWLAVGVGQQGRDDQAILIVDLVDGTYELPPSIGGRNLSGSFGPSLTWSADSAWILSLDGEPLAIRLEDGFTMNLAEYIPEGMVVYGVAAPR